MIQMSLNWKLLVRLSGLNIENYNAFLCSPISLGESLLLADK
jgi:hypothetical protein